MGRADGRSRMRLAPEETELFYKLHHSVLAYTNRRLELVPDFEDAEDAGERRPHQRHLDVAAGVPSQEEESPVKLGVEGQQDARSRPAHRSPIARAMLAASIGVTVSYE